MGHYLVIPDEEFGGMRMMPVPVPKGGVLLLTNRTPHASFENKTDVVRWSMDLRYQGAALPTNAKITRLSGEAKTLGTVGVPVACNPPEPDFLVRSRLRPNEVMKTPEEFVALRKNHVYQPATDRWGYSIADRKDPLGNPYKTAASLPEKNTSIGSTIAGSVTIARAIATRCCWPPESSDGTWCIRSPTRPAMSAASASCRRSCFGTRA